MRKHFVWIGLLVSLPAFAQVCEASRVNRELQYYRRLSFDLRGYAPSLAELSSVVAAGEVTSAQLDALVGSADVAKVMRRFVRDLLWTALNAPLTQDFQLADTHLSTSPAYPASAALWVPNRSRSYRNAQNLEPCADREQTAFDAQGRPVPVIEPSGIRRDGWVRLHPYWEPDPTTVIKVCAFDAQAALTSAATGASCAIHASSVLTDCGCGPALDFCQGSSNGLNSDTLINAAFAEQALKLVDRAVNEGAPWTELITSNQLDVNGAIAHYLTWQSGTTVDFFSRSDLGFAVPNIPFAAGWQRATVSGRAAGVLTTPFYLLKFASNRGRANRFYSAFMCREFAAPAGGLPNPSDSCSREPNLVARCGCQSCHGTLEPLAASWGRYAERGIFELGNTEFPAHDATCATAAGANDPRCRNFYFTTAGTDAERPYLGSLRPYVFADVNLTTDKIEQGPLKLAQAAIADGSFAHCTVRKLFSRLVGRAIREDLSDENAQLEQLSTRFVGSGYQIRSLLKDLVTSPQYRNPSRGDAR